MYCGTDDDSCMAIEMFDINYLVLSKASEVLHQVDLCNGSFRQAEIMLFAVVTDVMYHLPGRLTCNVPCSDCCW